MGVYSATLTTQVSTLSASAETESPGFCGFYSPDATAVPTSASPQQGIYTDPPWLSLPVQVGFNGGSGPVNTGLNLYVAGSDPTSPIAPNTPNLGIFAYPTTGSAPFPPYSIEFSATGVNSCQNPGSATVGACPYAVNLNALAIAQGSTPCLLSSGNTGSSAIVYVDTTGSSDGEQYGFCAYQPATLGFAASTMYVSSSAGGPPSGCNPIDPTSCGGFGNGTQPPVNLSAATNAICGIYFIINTVLFILALTIMIIGGAVYAGANVLPGNTRGAIQGYAMGMIMGGIVGALIAVVAPWVLSVIVGNSVSQIVSFACPLGAGGYGS
jgi:hypothetical protein